MQMECAVLGDGWDRSVGLLATDVSPRGLWLASDLVMEAGQELVLTFRPPRWPDWGAPITALAKVVRAGLARRQADGGRAGMGLLFEDIDSEHVSRMSELMRGLPPPLPRAIRQPLLQDEELELDDGTRLIFCAEAPLLTATRPADRAREVVLIPRTRNRRRSALALRLAS